MTSSAKSDKRRKDLRAQLIDSLGEAAEPDVLLSQDECERIGVPRKYSSAVSRASRTATTPADAVEAADEWATTIADWFDEQDALTPEQIIAKVPRLI